MGTVWRDVLVAGKDLRIEVRSKVVLNQIVPFSMVVLLLFGFALDPDRGCPAGGHARAVLDRRAAVDAGGRPAQLSPSKRPTPGATRLRLTGLDPAGVFLGKAGAAFVVLALLEVALAVGVRLMYGTSLSGWPVLVVAALTATIGPGRRGHHLRCAVRRPAGS